MERRRGISKYPEQEQLNNSNEESSAQQQPSSSSQNQQQLEDFYFQPHRDQYYSSNSSSRNSAQAEYSEKVVLKKPSIPLILRSPSTPDYSSNPEEAVPSTFKSTSTRKSSILKKKKQDFHNTNTVSFELDCSPSITRTKSTESNLSCSCESETGYWSCGEVSSSRSSLGSTGGILKNRCGESDSDSKSILRRSSNPSLNSADTSSQTELHSILKRKLSYDSSVLLNEASSSASRSHLTLSTNSLPSSYCCSCSLEPKPILKKKSSSEDLDEDHCTTVVNPKPILKKRTKKVTDRDEREAIRPILKKSTSEWIDDDQREEKKRGKKGILKRASLKSSDDDESDFVWTRESSLTVASVGDFSRFSPTPSSPVFQERRSSEPTTSTSSINQESRKPRSASFKSSSTMDHRSESEEDILLGLSVAEKRSLFMQLERESNMNSKRRTNRFRTQPVTNGEVEAAQLMNNSKIDNVIKDCVKVKTQMRKGKLLSSMLGAISDSANLDERKKITATGSEDDNEEMKYKRSEVVISRVDSFSLKDRIRMFNNNYINNNNNGMQQPCNKYNYKKRVIGCFGTTTDAAADEKTKQEDVMDSAGANTRRQGQVVEHEHVELHTTQKNGVSTAAAPTVTASATGPSRQSTSTIINSLATASLSSSHSPPPPLPLSFDEVQGQDEDGTQLVEDESILKFSEPSETSQIEPAANTSEESISHLDENVEAVSPSEDKEQQRSSESEDGTMDSKVVSFVKKQLSRSSSCSFSSSNNNMEIPYNNNQVIESKTKISERIAALKENGEISWLKRVPPKKNEVVVGENDQENVDSMNKKNSANIIKSRLSLLEKSQATWKKRISESDATDFTVEGRLAKAGLKPATKIPSTGTKLVQSKSQTQLATPKFSIPTCNDIVIDGGGDSNGELRLNEQKTLSKSKTVSKLQQLSSSSDSNEEDTTVKITVAENDNETFRQFFPTTKRPESVTIDESSFAAIKKHELLTGVKKPIKVNRKHGNTRNPVKALASRLSEQSYVEKDPEIREREIKKRIQVENLAKTVSHLSIEALAGLASKEDFTAVRLKKANNTNVAKEYPFPMLLQVKGKRFVQSRLVKPDASSLSSGDCFLLITGYDKVYQFIGEFANRMEKSKLSDITNIITQKRELGCRNARIVTFEEPVLNAKDYDGFLKALGNNGKKRAEDVLGDEHDETYELGVVRTNRVYTVQNGVLSPFRSDDGGWEMQPKYSILKDDSVLIFDFASELYVWSGSKADPALKKESTNLAKEMFEANYMIQDDFSPVDFGSKRPSWCWFKRITQFMEPVLFREKFFDWPDDELIRKFTRKDDSTRGSFDKDPGYNFQPLTATDMMKLYSELDDAGLVLEGFNVGRGRSVYDERERRLFVIESSNIKTWHITADSTERIETNHFYSTETYVIRWQYVVKQTTRDLKGNESRHAAVGRERTAYFFWHGAESSIGDKGASALMTVELDQEKGPQVRVVQGAEPPAFLSLHNGLWFFNYGSRNECDKKSQRFFVAMGAKEEEGHLVEVPVDNTSFRSKGSFVYCDVGKCIYVWHGVCSPSVSKKISKNSAYEFRLSTSLGSSVKIVEIEEGEEPETFLKLMKITNVEKWRESYGSFIGCAKKNSEFQLFRFTTLNGMFEAVPISSTRRGKDIYDPFPILQEELYSVPQPALFLLTSSDETWLWQGWISTDNEEENSTTGSLSYRWQAERKAALFTANNFSPNGKLVSAGSEPTAFIALFPYWKKAATELNGEPPIKLSDALKPYTHTATYTLEELQARPEGVDVLKLESYLSDDEFENLLKMSRAEFDKLQHWKKTEIKKHVGLF